MENTGYNKLTEKEIRSCVHEYVEQFRDMTIRDRNLQIFHRRRFPFMNRTNKQMKKNPD